MKKGDLVRVKASEFDDWNNHPRDFAQLQKKSESSGASN